MLLESLRRRQPPDRPSPTAVPHSSRRRLIRALFYCFLSLVGWAILVLLFRFLLVPLLVLYDPQFDSYFYDLGVYGVYPERHYRSFNLTSPSPRTPKWNASVCEREYAEGGLVLADLSGKGSHSGPAIFDLKGNLVWLDNSFGERCMNLQWQKWKGKEYLTFWAGEWVKDMGVGKYYMLDSGFNVAHTVEAVGEGLRGDPHEFRITADDTALITISPRTQDVDVASTHMDGMRPDILDAVMQEVDIETGELLFEWRGSEHFNDGEYLKFIYDPTPAHRLNIFERIFGPANLDPIDYFHMNSLDKDSDGNYLVSIRKTHQIICISGTTGEILWGFGGRASDFILKHGEPDPSDFRWQHDARWVDEENGILSLFDNGMSKGDSEADDPDKPFSQARIIDLNVANRSARQLHSYTPLQDIRSISQGSVQFLPGTDRARDTPNAGISASTRDLVFTGWGSAYAFTLHDADTEELLCETHFVPSHFFSWERIKSYRMLRAPASFKFRPERWDPHAVSRDGKVYVSWNGGVEVRSWLLQGGKGESDKWKDVLVVGKEEFETAIDLPDDGDYSAYRIAALDADGNVLRHSNVVGASSVGVPFWTVLLIGAAAIVIATVAFAYVRELRSGSPRQLTEFFRRAGKRGDGYRKLEDQELRVII